MQTEISAIRHASRQLVREFKFLDGQSRIEGVRFSECHFLTELGSMGRATASELADRLVLEKSTVSRLMSNLVDTGLVDVQAQESDRRHKHLVLTQAGQETVQAIHNYANKQVFSALQYVPEELLDTVVEGMNLYARAMQYSRISEQYQMRPIEEADNPQVCRIIHDVMTEFGAVGAGYSINDPEVAQMFQAYNDSRSRFYVITSDDEILGCGGIAPLIDGGEHVCELRKMYFLPQLRGTGMGSKLIRECLHQAKELGFTQCYLETLESMHAARTLYRKFGFSSIDHPMGNTGHHACNQWMIKNL